MTAPSPSGRQPCCGASAIASNWHHWEDCPQWEPNPDGGWRERTHTDPRRTDGS